ncbi:PRC-barrel protein [Sphingomonas sp. MM-1]|uniref:hypothetical protein n=1 Tax=Sphingomonas sp. MM-1 TaxID=745310 RepID=UPI0002C04E27|nr:hypothetical protein [Sphingomonas sp. MM-1]AGH47899.1 PRC-barrel protein [Sphingomonas sp. MM-1]
MEDIAGWIAPAATMVAAMMTAANLGSRITGWGFVVFTIGSVAWTVVAISTGQRNLLAANIFLSGVNLIGIWRWLGREARLDDGARAARRHSRAAAVPDLFAITAMEGQPLKGLDGAHLGSVAGATAEVASGRIAYLLVRIGGVAGIGESFRALGWDAVTPEGGGFRTALSEPALAALPEVDPACWPAAAADLPQPKMRGPS